jgi:hypothetical protein
MPMLAALHVFIVNNGASPLLTTLLPAVIGALLGFGGSLLLRRGDHDWQKDREADAQRWHEQREQVAQEWQAEQQRVAHEREVAWQEQRDRVARDVQIAKPLDDALVETQRRVQGELVPEGQSPWSLAHDEWQNGWVRITPHLTDDELEDRYRAVGTILQEAEDRANEGIAKGTLLTVTSRAILNARLAVAYFPAGCAASPTLLPRAARDDRASRPGRTEPTCARRPASPLALSARARTVALERCSTNLRW